MLQELTGHISTACQSTVLDVGLLQAACPHGLVKLANG
jgi:hypothetical protein